MVGVHLRGDKELRVPGVGRGVAILVVRTGSVEIPVAVPLYVPRIVLVDHRQAVFARAAEPEVLPEDDRPRLPQSVRLVGVEPGHLRLAEESFFGKPAQVDVGEGAVAQVRAVVGKPELPLRLVAVELASENGGRAGELQPGPEVGDRLAVERVVGTVFVRQHEEARVPVVNRRPARIQKQTQALRDWHVRLQCLVRVPEIVVIGHRLLGADSVRRARL